MYGTHYSCPGFVLHFLLRQEPFTRLALLFQDGRFDVPDRIFYSMESSWRSIKTSPADVKELVPEFFFCPEMFMNSNKLPFGVLHDGSTIVDDVILPPWAHNDPHEFIRLHREALESDYVSDNLHHWIDLIFGYKQTGPEAVKAHNLFRSITYENTIPMDEILDQEARLVVISLIDFGQTPSKIFDQEHPQRTSRQHNSYPFTSDNVGRLIHFTPSKQAFSEYSLGAIISICASADKLITVHTDYTVCASKWAVKAEGGDSYSLGVVLERVRRLDVNPMKLREVEYQGSLEASAALMEECAPPSVINASLTRTDASLGGEIDIAGPREPANSKSATKVLANSLGPSNIKMQLRKESVVLSSLEGGTSRVITCGYWDNALRVHALDTLKETVSAVSGHIGAITCIQVDKKGGHIIITGGEDGTCRVWALESPTILPSFYDDLRPAAIDSGFYDPALVCLHVLCGHQAPIITTHYAADLDMVVSGSADGSVCLHTVRRGTFVRTLLEHSGVPVVLTHILSDGYVLVHTAHNLQLRLFWINGDLLAAVEMESRYGNNILITSINY
jgi:hypothetical protein